jgi:prepilin-type N-terminal cleavage/methylation domain-containing protein
MRSAFTLLETLVAIVILAVLMALAVAAAQKVRASAEQARSQNNLRQIVLGVHSLSTESEGKIKGLTQAKLPHKPLYEETTIFCKILDHIEARPPGPPPPGNPTEFWNWVFPNVPTYLSPADPTLDLEPAIASLRGRTSYVCNMMAFNGVVTYPVSIPDGTHQTIAFAEHYFYKPSNRTSHIFLRYHHIHNPLDNTPSGMRRATFADAGYNDVLPVRDPATSRTVASRRGATFQVRPAFEMMDDLTPSTPFAAGLPVALFDGSVRTLSPRIEEHVFWSLVTPAGGEVVGDY